MKQIFNLFFSLRNNILSQLPDSILWLESLNLLLFIYIYNSQFNLLNININFLFVVKNFLYGKKPLTMSAPFFALKKEALFHNIAWRIKLLRIIKLLKLYFDCNKESIAWVINGCSLLHSLPYEYIES